ncbi:MAG: hypothetical protein RIF32_13355 [Leptospirales bacterium]|jgi:hypothetical protein
MFASFDISRPGLRRRPSRSMYFRRPVVGAIFALIGFVSQYPIPVIHRCPVMNPNGIAVIDGSDASDSSDPARRKSAHDHDHNHSDGHPADSETSLQDLPPCHRALAAARASAGSANHHHHADHAQTEGGNEAGHSHDSCPVCQGHAQLIQALPAPALTALTTLYRFQARVPYFAATPRVLHFSKLPPARAPPPVA